MTEQTPASTPTHQGEDTDITPAAVLATRRALRTGLMWVMVGAIIAGVVVTIMTGPKIGAFYFALLMIIVGTLRWALPGQPFGIAAREQKWKDIIFCYAVSAGLIILASTSYALRCTEGFLC
ncbi:DUF3017 domain-containing protein [Populibacterium corticicola]|uniref:DUF3017 domain-containing protein n=1 Tax=Populibacterium corticicola TaxID=1812826 RepID=A0ABW5XEN7_9MICO